MSDMNDTVSMLVQALTAYMNEKGIKEFKVKLSDIEIAEASGQMLIIDDEDGGAGFCTVTLLDKDEAEKYLDECQKEDDEEATCGCCMTDCGTEELDADCEPLSGQKLVTRNHIAQDGMGVYEYKSATKEPFCGDPECTCCQREDQPE